VRWFYEEVIFLKNNYPQTKVGDDMDRLFKKLGILPNELKLYTTAFSHSSYVHEHNLKSDYERLEFLGDKVLDLAISDYLYNNFDKKEGDMTKIRASYVCENACCRYAQDLNFSDYIKVGHGEEIDGGRYKKVILADIFESFCGAMYLDLGYETAKEKILSIIVPYILDPEIIFFSDYKSALQEFVQTDGKSVTYEIVNETGPAHNKEFQVVLKVDGIIFGKGIGTNKKEAEQEAAKDALEKLAL